jgi:hypothetical protein
MKNMYKFIWVILISTIILQISTITYAQVVTTDSWSTDRWGGDNGEDSYQEPPPVIPGEEPDGSLCSGVILIGCVIPSYFIMTYKKGEKKNE